MLLESQRRLGMFLPTLHGGGAERVTATLANEFARRGFAVDMVLSRAEGTNVQRLSRRVRVVDLKAGRVAKSLPSLVRYLRSERPSWLLSVQEHANVVAIAAKLLLLSSETRVAASIHTTLSRWIGSSTNNVRDRIVLNAARLLYPRADAILAVSEGVARDAVRTLGLDKQSVRKVNNPAVTPELFVQAKEPVDHPWFNAGEPPVLVAVGRLTPAKDFTTLLRALVALRRRMEVRLVILGEGEDRRRLEMTIHELALSDHVRLFGFVDNPYKYLARGSAFVLSSAWEGLPTVLIEALALKKPIVATNCDSGPYEILHGGAWGELVPIGDSYIMAEAIARALEQPPERIPDQAWQPYSIESAADSYLSVLDAALHA